MKNKINLKSSVAGLILTAAIAMLCTVTCQAEPPAATPAPTPSTLPQPAVNKAEAVNYFVRVQWVDAKGTTNLLQVVTTEGDFKMETTQSHLLKIDNLTFLSWSHSTAVSLCSVRERDCSICGLPARCLS
jgi:hypothetical protein